MGCPQLIASVHAPPFASQPLAVEEAGASEIDPHARSAESLDGLDVQVLGRPAFGQERARACRESERPVRTARPRHLHELAQRIVGHRARSGTDGRLDQLDPPPGRAAELLWLFGDPSSGGQSLLVAAEAVVQHGLGPVEHRDPDSLAALRHGSPTRPRSATSPPPRGPAAQRVRPLRRGRGCCRSPQLPPGLRRRATPRLSARRRRGARTRAGSGRGVARRARRSPGRAERDALRSPPSGRRPRAARTRWSPATSTAVARSPPCRHGRTRARRPSGSARRAQSPR